MGRKFRDISNQQFGKLTALELVGKTSYGSYRWKCLCSCGRVITTQLDSLVGGLTKSCGCSRFRDITGQVFTRLTALERVGKDKHGSSLWKCLCSCGQYLTTRQDSITSGRTQSCGCITLEQLQQPHRLQQLRLNNRKHGHAIGGMSREYHSWQAMKRRCLDQNHDNYPYYGGRASQSAKDGSTLSRRFFPTWDQGQRTLH